MIPSNSHFSQLKQLSFDIQKEVWNKYELEENADLRIRIVLTKVLQRNTDEKPVESDYIGEGTTIISIIPGDGYKLYGKPQTRPYTADEISSAKQVEIEWRTISEDWNVYKLMDGKTFRTKLVVASIRRLEDRYDQYGVPMYITNSSVVFSISGFN